MKLLYYYNRVNLATTIIILLFSSICYYVLLSYMLINELDQDLRVAQKEIISFTKKYNYLPDTTFSEAQQTSFTQTNIPVKKRFCTYKTYSKKENEFENRRTIVFSVSAGGKNYTAAVSKSQEETEDLIQLIVGMTLIVVLFLLTALFLINRFFMKKMWKPFYHSLSEIDSYNLRSNKAITFSHSKIEEFNSLNKSIASMADHTKKEYNSLKSFTENASHELQTPFAIIKVNLELLSQSDTLSSKQSKMIANIQTSVNKSSKLIQSLLLLTKIENNQFSENSEVNIAIFINHYNEFYEELLSAKKITMTTEILDESKILMNETLADILISNLIVNAIKHNIDMGFIKIHLEKNVLIISNSGRISKENPETLFQRFKKDNTGSESLGLGLSIVKTICEQYEFGIGYKVTNSTHTVTLTFK